MNIVNNLKRNLEKAKIEGSGWSVASVKHLTITYYSIMRSTKTYGKYEPWPTGVSGMRQAVNLPKERDCLK